MTSVRKDVIVIDALDALCYCSADFVSHERIFVSAIWEGRSNIAVTKSKVGIEFTGAQFEMALNGDWSLCYIRGFAGHQRFHRRTYSLQTC